MKKRTVDQVVDEIVHHLHWTPDGHSVKISKDLVTEILRFMPRPELQSLYRRLVGPNPPPKEAKTMSETYLMMSELLVLDTPEQREWWWDRTRADRAAREDGITSWEDDQRVMEFGYALKTEALIVQSDGSGVQPFNAESLEYHVQAYLRECDPKGAWEYNVVWVNHSMRPGEMNGQHMRITAEGVTTCSGQCLQRPQVPDCVRHLHRWFEHLENLKSRGDMPDTDDAEDRVEESIRSVLQHFDLPIVVTDDEPEPQTPTFVGRKTFLLPHQEFDTLEEHMEGRRSFPDHEQGQPVHEWVAIFYEDGRRLKAQVVNIDGQESGPYLSLTLRETSGEFCKNITTRRLGLHSLVYQGREYQIEIRRECTREQVIDLAVENLENLDYDDSSQLLADLHRQRLEGLSNEELAQLWAQELDTSERPCTITGPEPRVLEEQARDILNQIEDVVVNDFEDDATQAEAMTAMVKITQILKQYANTIK